MSSESVEQLLTRWQDGDETAARAIYERFQARLLHFTTPRIQAMLRPKVQPESVVLHTMEYVLRKIKDGRYAPRTSGEFMKLATRVAENKIRNLWDYFTAAIRDIRREQGSGLGGGNGKHGQSDDLVAQTTFMEELERAQGILSPKLFRVLTLRLEGYSSAETAKVLGVTRQSVTRYRREIAWRLGYVPAPNSKK